jgi:hypothetical protein
MCDTDISGSIACSDWRGCADRRLSLKIRCLQRRYGHLDFGVSEGPVWSQSLSKSLFG